MGTGADLRIIQRVTKIVKDAGDTLIVKAADELELLIWLRHAGALGQADVKRQRSLKRQPDYAGFRQIKAALEWGQGAGKLSVVRSPDKTEYVLTSLPLAPIVDADEELPAGTCIDPSMFKPLNDYEGACDPSVFRHLGKHAWRLALYLD